MVTLTTEHGEFTAETPGEASKLARQAARQARKAEEEEASNRNQAKLLAKENGWRAYYRQVKGKPMGWSFLPLTDEYFPKCRLDGGYRYYRLECANGYGELRLYHTDRLAGVVWDAGGCTVLVFIEVANQAKDKTGAWAVATCNGVLEIADCDGVKAEIFSAVD